MNPDPRILNLSRGFRLKRNQALKAIEQCACEWVEVGVSVRDLTLAESITKRNEQAKIREPLAEAEIPGLLYQPTECNVASNRESRRLSYEASKFFMEATA